MKPQFTKEECKKIQNVIGHVKLVDLEYSSRLLNRLEELNLITVQDVFTYGLSKIKSIKGIGRHSYNELLTPFYYCLEPQNLKSTFEIWVEQNYNTLVRIMNNELALVEAHHIFKNIMYIGNEDR
jgi:hypothetical protein